MLKQTFAHQVKVFAGEILSYAQERRRADERRTVFSLLGYAKVQRAGPFVTL